MSVQQNRIKHIKKKLAKLRAEQNLSLELVRCSPWHYQVRGGKALVNYWPKSGKIYAPDHHRASIVAGPAEVVRLALEEVQRFSREAVSGLASGPRCKHCAKSITVKDDIAFDGPSMIHQTCKGAN
jgi:hypothetical protein